VDRLFRLLTLIAVLLLPLGMQPVAAAPAMSHHGAAMPMQHCPEQGSKHDGKAGFDECTMVCSSALPAVSLAQPALLLLACAPEMSGVTQILHGLQPETATPPPKRS
jgi:hypothetical protein